MTKRECCNKEGTTKNKMKATLHPYLFLIFNVIFNIEPQKRTNQFYVCIFDTKTITSKGKSLPEEKKNSFRKTHK